MDHITILKDSFLDKITIFMIFIFFCDQIVMALVLEHNNDD